MKTIHLNKQTWRNMLARWRGMIGALPHIVLVERFTLVRLLLMGLFGLVALGLVLALLYGAEPVPTDTIDAALKLNTDAIDKLELWIEERQDEQKQTIAPPGRSYFK